VAFVGFSRIFLLGILIFKGITARRVYKSFGAKGLKKQLAVRLFSNMYFSLGEFRFIAALIIDIKECVL
jgi:hypothetical protein